MNLSKPFILRPVFTTLVMLCMVVFGCLAYNELPVSSIPQIQFPTIQVSTSYPGANPDTISKLVSMPLERQFMLMQGIEFVSSSNTYGSSAIILQFHENVDINVAAQETEQAIQKALAQLPPDLPQNPTYEKFNPSDTPITYIVVYSDIVDAGKLYEYGYSFLGQQIGTVNGVANIQMYGYPRAVRVMVDPQKLAAMDITLKEVSTAINDGNPQQPTGKLYGPNRSISTLSEGQLVEAKDYEDLIIKYVNNSPVRLKDVAKIENSLQNNKQTFSWVTKDVPDGQGACVLAVFREIGYNTVQICDGVETLVNELRPQLPGGIEVKIPFSLSTWIKEAVEDVEFTLIVAFILVVIVVYLYLGRIKNSIIPLITLPITVICTFIFMKLFGYSLDIMSLSALTLSIGFLVDDAIVVLENIVRWAQEKKLAPFEAALEGSKQIMLVIVSMSLCLCAVFLPMLFLEGSVGQIFHEFSAVIIIAVIISGFISLSLTPMLCSRFLAHYDEMKETKMEHFSTWLNNIMLGVYQKMLGFSLKHKFWVLIAASGSVFLSVYLFLSMPQEFLPPNDLGVIQAFAQAPEGTSPERMGEYLDKITETGIKNKYVKTMAKLQSTPTDNQGLFFCNLIDRDDRPDIWTVIADLEKEFQDVIGVNFFMKAFPLINLQLGGITAGKAQYQYVLQSFDTNALYKGTVDMLEKMKASPKLSKVTSDFQPNAPVLKLDLLRDRAHSYGNISARGIENALMNGYGETYISKINQPQDMYYVILQVEDKFYKDPGELSTLYLEGTDDSGQVSMRSVTDQKMITKPETINHLNALPANTLVFDPAPGVALSEALEEVKTLSEETLSHTVMTKIVGNTAAFEKAMAEFIGLIILAIFVIYVILGILYENFLHPITALASIPVALFGGLLTLLIFGEALSIYALVGLIMLLGIVMKNGILIIDFTLEIMEDEGMAAHDAVYKACSLRFRPIVMTTIAAMMGALPIALGIGGTVAAGRAPLGIAVVGGLIFAQIVTLFVTPVVFVYIHRLDHYLRNHISIFKEKGGTKT